MIRFLTFLLISSFMAACSPTSESEQPAVLTFKVPVADDLDTEIVIEVDTLPQVNTTEEAEVVVSDIEMVRGYEVKYLAVHCTASPPSQKMKGIVNLDWWFKARGWRKWGYHVVFFRDGKIEILNPAFQLDKIMMPEEVVYGVKGLNRQTISIAYVGGVSEKLVKGRSGLYKRTAEDNMTDAQFYAMRGFIQAVQSAIPDIQIGGHRDFRAMRKEAYKACPSFEVSEKFADVISEQNRLKY